MGKWIRISPKEKIVSAQRKYNNRTYLLVRVTEALHHGWQEGDKVILYILSDNPACLLIYNKSLEERLKKEKESSK